MNQSDMQNKFRRYNKQELWTPKGEGTYRREILVMLGYRKKSSYCLLEVSYQLPYREVRRLHVGKAAGRRKNETKLYETSFVDRDKKI
jgi:hypothetical protein